MDDMTAYYEQLRKDAETNPGKIVAKMEKDLAHAIRMAEDGWRGDSPHNAMEIMEELFDTPQPLHIWERCLEICTLNELQQHQCSHTPIVVCCLARTRRLLLRPPRMLLLWREVMSTDQPFRNERSQAERLRVLLQDASARDSSTHAAHVNRIV
jgi:hypothetical protein